MRHAIDTVRLDKHFAQTLRAWFDAAHALMSRSDLMSTTRRNLGKIYSHGSWVSFTRLGVFMRPGKGHRELPPRTTA